MEPGPQRPALRLAQRRPVAVRPPQDVVDDARRVPAPDAAAPALPRLPALARAQVFPVQPDQGHAAADRVVFHPGVEPADVGVGDLQVVVVVAVCGGGLAGITAAWLVLVPEGPLGPAW